MRISSLIDVDGNKIIDAVIENMDVGPIEFAAEEFIYQNNEVFSEEELEDMTEEDIFNTKECQKWLRNNLRNELYDQINMYENSFEKGVLPIYRALSFNEMKNWGFIGGYVGHLEKQGKHLGIYWSYDADRADAHWGDHVAGSEVFVLESEVSPDKIDWEMTLIMNLDPLIGDIETEVRLFMGVPLKIKNVWKRTGSSGVVALDLSDEVMGKVFLASELL